KALIIVFNASEIIFYNSSATEICASKKWYDVFCNDDLQDQLMQFFETGELEEGSSMALAHLRQGDKTVVDWKFRDITTSDNQLMQLFETGELEEGSSMALAHLRQGDKTFVEWKFRDISTSDNQRICLAIGDAVQKSPKKALENPIPADGLPFDNELAQIDRYRVLASNIPFTNVFLIDKELKYIVAEGPNFKYWGLDKSYFEGKSLEEVHTTNLTEIGPMVLKAMREKQTVVKELFYMKRVYHLTAKPIVSDGEVEYILGIARDIS